MSINRREFLVSWMAQRRSTQGITVEVLEVFNDNKGPSGLLVHHDSAELRQAFAAWLQGSDGMQIRLRTSNGAAFSGRIFRVRMCFGRGLVLVPTAVGVRIKDKIRIDPSID
jgi:hypothetical protein